MDTRRTKVSGIRSESISRRFHVDSVVQNIKEFEMDTFLKILELFSRNWLIVLVLVLVLPIVKIGIQGAINIHIAKISNKNRVVYNIQTGRKVQSLEIHSNNLNLKELSKHMETFSIENKENVLLIEDNKEKEAA